MKKTQPKPCQNQKLHLDYSLEERLLSRLTREAQSREEIKAIQYFLAVQRKDTG